MVDENLYSKLEAMAFKKSTAFCYSCYKESKTGRCQICHSDDLMWLLPGVGVEWGLEWVFESIIDENLTPVDIDSAFEDSLEDCYPATTEIGWLKVNTINAVKTLDDISWKIGMDEWIDSEVEEGNLITFDNGSNYYHREDIKKFLDEAE